MSLLWPVDVCSSMYVPVAVLVQGINELPGRKDGAQEEGDKERKVKYKREKD